jgi:hypothetical protein
MMPTDFHPWAILRAEKSPAQRLKLRRGIPA